MLKEEKEVLYHLFQLGEINLSTYLQLLEKLENNEGRSN